MPRSPQRIRDIVAAGHINLAETLAERIAEACFVDARVKTARVRVEKLHALPGAESAGVEIERDAGLSPPCPLRDGRRGRIQPDDE